MKSYQESKTTGKNPAEERDQNLEEQKVSLPNSYVMRIFDNGGAEDEANTLSTGVRASTPNSLRREMGSRLHADFSSVHFHEGPESVRKNDAMRARAFTQGRDVYFGRGGFDPMIGAHELVHTVQQGAVRGSVQRSAPSGSVQLFSWKNILPWNWRSAYQERKRKKADRKDKISRLTALYSNERRAENEEKSKSKPKSDDDDLVLMVNGKEFGESNGNPEENDKKPLIEEEENLISLKDESFDVKSEKPGDKSEKEIQTSSKKSLLDNSGELVNKTESDPREELQTGLERINLNEKQMPGSGKEQKIDKEKISIEDDEPLIRPNAKQNGSGEKNNNQVLLPNLMNADDNSSFASVDENALQAGYTGGNEAAGIAKDISRPLEVTKGAVNAGSKAYVGLSQGVLSNLPAGISTSVNVGANTFGGLTGAVTTGANAYDTYKNFKNVAAGGERKEYVRSGLDTLSSLSATAVGGLGIANSITGSTVGGAGLVPGLGIVSGAASAISGGMQWARAEKARKQIDEQKEKLKALRGMDKKKKNELRQIFEQGKRVSSINAENGMFKLAGGAMNATMGIGTLLLPVATPLLIAAGIASAAIALAGFVRERWTRKRMKRDIVAQDYGYKNWANAKNNIRQRSVALYGDTFRDNKLTEDEIEQILVQAHGFTNIDDVFDHITQKRANALIDAYNDAIDANPERVQEAEVIAKVISSLGVHRKGGRYAAGARKLLAAKLK